MNTAIIVAAGAGNRFGGDTPKQFLTLRGKALLAVTISRFEECVDIDEIVVVTAEDRIESVSGLKSEFSKLKAVVEGGATRSESVRNGLSVADTTGIVAVHDGARPLVTAEEISRTVLAAKEHGAACLAVPVTDTIKQTEGGYITGTLDRTALRAAVTPQCFRFEIIERAFAESHSVQKATDECALVERLGIPIRIVEGSPRNIKITVAGDLKLAEALLDDQGLRRCSEQALKKT